MQGQHGNITRILSFVNEVGKRIHQGYGNISVKGYYRLIKFLDTLLFVVMCLKSDIKFGFHIHKMGGRSIYVSDKREKYKEES
jgi:hypothetical protein